jgi:hypothetical protein
MITTDHWVIMGMIRDIPGQFRIKLSLRFSSRRGVTPREGPGKQGVFAREAAGRGCFTPNMGYLPAFWSLPSLFLTEAAAAASIGMINAVGNLGGFLGPYVLGKVETITGSFRGGIAFLGVSIALSATVVLVLGFFGRSIESRGLPLVDPLPGRYTGVSLQRRL